MTKEEKIILIKILEDWFENFMQDKAVLVGKKGIVCFNDLIKKIEEV